MICELACRSQTLEGIRFSQIVHMSPWFDRGPSKQVVVVLCFWRLDRWPVCVDRSCCARVHDPDKFGVVGEEEGRYSRNIHI